VRRADAGNWRGHPDADGEDDVGATPPEQWFGGPKHSFHVDAHEWLVYADGCDSPYLEAAAVAEALKFVPDGADAVPREAMLLVDHQEELDRHPERYEKAALEARFTALVAQVAAETGGDTVP
jgi:hypothetical protein